MKTYALFDEHEKIKACRLIKVVETCWNSHIVALNQHLENRPAVVCLCSTEIYEHLKLEKYALQTNEWAILEQSRPVLQVSYTDTAILRELLTSL